METQTKTVTTINQAYILTKDELIALLISSKILPKESTNITIEYNSDKLCVYAETKNETKVVITHAQREMLDTPIEKLRDDFSSEHPLSIATQTALRRHSFKTLQDCITFTKEGLLKKKYFPIKIVLELEDFFKNKSIPFD